MDIVWQFFTTNWSVVLLVFPLITGQLITNEEDPVPTFPSPFKVWNWRQLQIPPGMDPSESPMDLTALHQVASAKHYKADSYWHRINLFTFDPSEAPTTKEPLPPPDTSSPPPEVTESEDDTFIIILAASVGGSLVVLASLGILLWRIMAKGNKRPNIKQVSPAQDNIILFTPSGKGLPSVEDPLTIMPSQYPFQGKGQAMKIRQAKIPTLPDVELSQHMA